MFQRSSQTITEIDTLNFSENSKNEIFPHQIFRHHCERSDPEFVYLSHILQIQLSLQL